jgi:hypothetical protein
MRNKTYVILCIFTFFVATNFAHAQDNTSATTQPAAELIRENLELRQHIIVLNEQVDDLRKKIESAQPAKSPEIHDAAAASESNVDSNSAGGKTIEQKTFDAEDILRRTNVESETLKIEEDAHQMDVAYGNPDAASSSDSVKKMREEINDLSKQYINWQSNLPPASDVPRLISGKTLTEAEKIMGTTIHSTLIMENRTAYSLDCQKYRLMFSVSGDTGKISKISVFQENP